MSAGDAILKVLEVAWKAGMVGIGVISVGAGLIALGVANQSLERQRSYANSPDRDMERVGMAARYDPAGCAQPTPLAVQVSNGSRRRLMRYGWGLAVYRPGFSGRIEKSRAATFEESDFIIEPGRSATFCVAVPELAIPSLRPEDLRFEAELMPVYVTFAP